ncbi:pyocin activator PrtN family protein [Vibrio ziniensis]|uniref:Pyocin activator protein PrtN n=1 Tax=Vibrio ziniensis TaxID=2711221 RepID=A0A6G7CLB1_9VIBR|nr:pyocin activator PrtN family protein [Vibrio ziniensis]QIH42864.1 hypothetical protein G5S32_13195 [Vibrio ziniensis]
MITKFNNLDAKVVLLMKFGMSPVIPLHEIAVEYLGMSFNTALKKARTQSLSLPAFRLDDSQKSEWMVSLEDLANLITQQADKARAEWEELRDIAL